MRPAILKVCTYDNGGSMAYINGQWVVQGHKRYALKDRAYPGIVATGNDQHSVRGILCEGLSPADVKRLDLYEGEVRYRVWIQSR